MPEATGDDAAWALVDAGAQAVRIEAHQDTSGAPADLDREAARLTASWPQEAFAAAAPLRLQVEAALQGVGSAVHGGRLAVGCYREQPWGHLWRGHFQPHKIGPRLWVVPTWANDFSPPRGAVVLRLDPGEAFGTGQHASTALCLAAIQRFAAAERGPGAAPAAMLDVGCGSGILALAGAALGLAPVHAIDNDPQALAAAAANVRRNQRAIFLDLAEAAGSAGSFDLVVANLFLGVLVDHAADLVARCRSGGTVVLAGILRGQANEALAAYRAAASAAGRRLAHVCRLSRGDWGALQLVVQDL